MKIHIQYSFFRTLFNFDLKELNWSEYIETYVKVNIFNFFFYKFENTKDFMHDIDT